MELFDYSLICQVVLANGSVHQLQENGTFYAQDIEQAAEQMESTDYPIYRVTPSRFDWVYVEKHYPIIFRQFQMEMEHAKAKGKAVNQGQGQGQGQGQS